MIDPVLLRAFELLRGHGAGDAENLLYSRWFHDEAENERSYPGPSAYRAATLDRGRFEPGWRVVATAAGMAGAVVAENGGERRVLAPPECAPERPGCLALGPGEPLLADPYAGIAQNGFWHLSPPAWRQQPAPLRQRLYFGVAPGGELAFARLVARQVPPEGNWTFKILCGPHRTGRRDVALLYLDAMETIDGGWVKVLVDAAGTLLTGTVPQLTRVLAPGVGWAPDPGDNLSYGQLLCRTLAEVASVDGVLASEEAWLDAARRALAGVIPDGVDHA